MSTHTTTMRAIQYRRTGPAREVLELLQLPLPTPGPGELRVKVLASGVNPSDVKARRGVQIRHPEVIPHSDGAGIVDALGEGVPAGRLGQRVWLYNAQWRRPQGTAAEYIVVPAMLAVPMPEGLGFAAAACLGIPALTAWEAVYGEGPVAGQTLLIQGGAGAVGHYAVQFAARAGARVIATVSSADKARHALAAGAEAAIDYKSEDLVARLAELTGGRGVDRIIEVNLSANAGLYTRLVVPQGRVTVYGSDDWQARMPLNDYLVHGLSLRFFIVYELTPAQRAAGIAGVHQAIAEGWLQHQVAARLPLEQTVAAHEMVEQGRQIGNVVVLPWDSEAAHD